jgi:hypothetical protein
MIMNILGVILILLGGLWLLQGFNVLGGSFMSGHIQYAILGIIVGILGILSLVFANRSKGSGNIENRS